MPDATDLHPFTPVLYLRLLGKDLDVPEKDPFEKKDRAGRARGQAFRRDAREPVPQGKKVRPDLTGRTDRLWLVG